MVCCHNDGDPANNHLENLRWDTYQSNEADKLRHGTRRLGSATGGSKLREEEVLEIRRRKGEGEPMRLLAAEFERQYPEHQGGRLLAGRGNTCPSPRPPTHLAGSVLAIRVHHHYT